MRQHDWRLVPLALGAWSGAAVGTAGHPWALAVGALVVLGVAWRWRRVVWAAVGALGFVVVGALALLMALVRGGSELAELADARAIVTAEVRVVSEPLERPPRPPLPASTTALGEVRWVEGRGERTGQRLPVLLVASGDAGGKLSGLATGSRHVVRARLAASEPGDDVVALVRLQEVVAEAAPPGPVQQLASTLRQGLRDAMVGSPEPQRALVPSLVVGDTSRITEAIDDDFRSTGLTHLLAVSGANLALMLGVILAVLRAVGVRGWPVRIAALGGVGMFVVICGPEPSVQRAAVMGLVSVAATGVGKGRRSVRALAVAVTALMALDPWLSRAPGFWLSCAACLGIVTLGPVCIAAMTRWCPRWLAEALSIPLSAQLLTQPIITGLSGEVSVVGVLTNMAAAPFVGPTTVLGFAAACTCWVGPLSSTLGWLAGWAAQPILWIAEAGARMPGATVTWLPGALGVVLVAALCAGLAVWLPLVLRRWWATAMVVLALVLGVAVRLPTPGWPGPWSVAFCDVGQGDATVIDAGDGAAILVDTGPDPVPVLACLDELGVRELPVVVLTHYHADHVGGFAAVAERYGPSLVLTAALPSPVRAADAVRVAAGSATVRPAEPGERLEVGVATWTTASNWLPSTVDGGDAGESAVENDASVVGVASSGGVRVLLPGDIEPAGQRAAQRSAAAAGVPLHADVLKLPHHGSSRQDEAFFAATGARLAVVSAGEDNDYGHPSRAALDLARSQGMTVARTDEQGTVTLVADGALQVRSRR